MQPEYEFLTEKKAMWAEVLEEVLRDWNIPYAALPVYGAGLALSAGTQECHRIYVPTAQKRRAEELLEAIFPPAGAGEDDGEDAED